MDDVHEERRLGADPGHVARVHVRPRLSRRVLPQLPQQRRQQPGRRGAGESRAAAMHELLHGAHGGRILQVECEAADALKRGGAGGGRELLEELRAEEGEDAVAAEP